MKSDKTLGKAKENFLKIQNDAFFKTFEENKENLMWIRGNWH